MTLSLPQHAVYVRRTEDWYLHLRQQACDAGHVIDFNLLDVRALVLYSLGHRRCRYCRGAVEPGTFALAYKVPADRGGSFTFHNLVVVCQDCHEAKGILDDAEYKELLGLLRSWSPPVRRHLLGLLQFGREREPTEPPPVPDAVIALDEDEDEDDDEWEG